MRRDTLFTHPIARKRGKERKRGERGGGTRRERAGKPSARRSDRSHIDKERGEGRKRGPRSQASPAAFAARELVAGELQDEAAR